MKPSPRENLEVSQSENNRRHITVDQHKLFIDSLLTPADHDEIDELVADMGPMQTRKESEVSRLLSLLDDIGKDGSH